VNTTPEGCLTTPQGSITVNLQNLAIPGEAIFYKNDGTLVGSYSITGNVNTMFATYSNLVSGNYKVIIRDFNNKRQVIEAFVPLRGNYTALLYAKDDVCSGAKGQIQVNLTNNFPFPASYTFFKNDVQVYSGSSPTLDNISSGNYKVNIVGTDGCLTQETTSITSSPGTYFPITPTVTNTSCSGSTGAISLNIGTAQSPTYLWSNGATTQNLTALAAGQYSVNVTDATGCLQTQKYDVFEEGGFSESLITSNQVNNDLSLSAGFLYFQTPVNSVDKIRVLNVLDNSYTDFTIPSYYNSNVTKKVENLIVKNNFLYGVVKETNNNITQIHFIKVDLNTKNIVKRVIYNQNKSFAKILFESDKLYALNGTTLEICNFNSSTVKSVNIPLNNSAFNFIFDFSRMKIYIVGWETQISEFDINTETIVRNATTNVRASQINLNSNELYEVYPIV
jgi:hypothetical protein